MPFVKTEVNIATDYTVESVDPEWLKQGVKSPKHLMLDPEPCILCRACEDVCPWNCIYMLDPGIVQNAGDEPMQAEVQNSFAIFVVDDNACSRGRAYLGVAEVRVVRCGRAAGQRHRHQHGRHAHEGSVKRPVADHGGGAHGSEGRCGCRVGRSGGR